MQLTDFFLPSVTFPPHSNEQPGMELIAPSSLTFCSSIHSSWSVGLAFAFKVSVLRGPTLVTDVDGLVLHVGTLALSSYALALGRASTSTG